MIIRSQDNEKLIVDNIEYVIYDTNIYYKRFDNESEIIAKYSTHKKALKVLDMLERYCRDYNKYNYYRYDDNSSSYNLNSKVFTFPKDDEVE